MKNILLIILLLFPIIITADESKKTNIIFGLDNDAFVNKDDYYTNGIFIGATYTDGYFDWGTIIYSWSIAHRMFTPHEIDDVESIITDIPYSSHFVFNFSKTEQDIDIMDAWTITFGLVGPSTHGDALQKEFHKMTSSSVPVGWDEQIKDEMLFNVFYEYRNRVYEHNNFSRKSDVILNSSIGFGNLASYMEFGVGLRYGINIPDDFYIPTPLFTDPTVGTVSTTGRTDYASYLFVYTSGSVIANAIILDGNTFKNSKSVHYDHYNFRIVFGVLMEFKKIQVVGTITAASIPWDNDRDDFLDIFSQVSFRCSF